MTNISVFHFEGLVVRFVGTAEKPEWVAADVCKILDLDTSVAINGRPDRPDSGLDEDEKGTAKVSTPGGFQEMLTVTEPGLYRFIFKSRKSVAKRFQRWVVHEVLPSIRQSGSYVMPQQDQKQLTPPTLVNPSNWQMSIHDQLAIINYVFDGFVDVDPKITNSAKEERYCSPIPNYATSS